MPKKTPELSPTNLPAQVRKRAEAAGLTITALADRAGMLQPQLARVVGNRDRKIQLATAIAIAEALGCRVDDLLRPIGRVKPVKA